MQNYTLLINPPLLKYNAGPPLGPCLLMQACREKNLPIEYLDLNFHALQRLSDNEESGRPVENISPLGDHIHTEYHLGNIESRFFAELSSLAPNIPRSQLQRAQLDWTDVQSLDMTQTVPEVDLLLAQGQPPAIAAFSIMVSRQVVWVLWAARKIRQIWPKTKIVLGGAYLGALDLTHPDHGEAQRQAWLAFADLLVLGHAEKSFSGMVTKAAQGQEIPSGICHGDHEWQPASSQFTLEQAVIYKKAFGNHCIMVPVQTSVGCAWGKCAFCTYPIIEPCYQAQSVASVSEMTIEATNRVGGAIVIRDSYVTATRLVQIAQMIRNRVRWAACTRLPDAAQSHVIEQAAAGGLHTLEIGLETLDENVSKRISKIQSKNQLLRACQEAQAVGVCLVINIIWGLPGQNLQEAIASRHFLRMELCNRFPGLHFQLEENFLELERGSQLAQHPEQFGIVPIRMWPFAVEIAYQQPDWINLLEDTQDANNHSSIDRPCGCRQEYASTNVV